MKSSKPCVLPWIAMEIKPTGQVRPCCIYYGHYQKEDGHPFHLGKDTLREAWNSESAKELRRKMRDGEAVPECQICWSEEAAGKRSKRINDNERFSHLNIDFKKTEALEPKYMDIKLGNICNLKCRTCSSENSNKWAKEELQLGYWQKNIDEHVRSGKWVQDNDAFWENFEELLPHVEKLDFGGGEPLLSKEHFRLLETCVQKGFAKNIDIHYNTNATIFPETAVQELWPHFKSTSVMLSIDGVEEIYEYMRHPGKWETVTETVAALAEYPFIYRTINYTISPLNLFGTLRFSQWASELKIPTHYNIVHYPPHYNLSVMPDSIRELALEHIEQCRPYMDSGEFQGLYSCIKESSFNASTFRTFYDYIVRVDALRGESFFELFPTLGAMIEEEWKKLPQPEKKAN